MAIPTNEELQGFGLPIQHRQRIERFEHIIVIKMIEGDRVVNLNSSWCSPEMISELKTRFAEKGWALTIEFDGSQTYVATLSSHTN